MVLGIIAGFSLTYWAKSNDKWCFAKPDTKPDYNQAPTSDPDIVKTKKEDTVKEEKEKSLTKSILSAIIDLSRNS